MSTQRSLQSKVFKEWKTTTTQQRQSRIDYGEEERKHLKNLVSLLAAQRPELNFNLIPSINNKKCPYDALLYIEDSFGNRLKSIIIEVKVRKSKWNSYFLEDYKYNSLKDLQQHHKEFHIWYVNFVPGETLIFDLDKIDLGKRKNIEMNAQTFKSTSTKIKKWVYDIDASEAQVIKYNKDNV